MKTFLMLFFLASLIQLAKLEPRQFEDDSYDDERVRKGADGRDGADGENGADGEPGYGSDIEPEDEEEEESAPPPKSKKPAAAPVSQKSKKSAAAPEIPVRKPTVAPAPAPLKKPANSPIKRTASPGNNSPKTAALPKSNPLKNAANAPSIPDLTSLNPGSLISSIATMPVDVVKTASERLTALTKILPGNSPVAALLNGLRFMFKNQPLMQVLDKALAPLNALSNMNGGSPGSAFASNPLSNAATQIFAIALKQSGTLIKSVAEIADAAFNSAKDLAEDIEQTTSSLRDVPVVGSTVGAAANLVKNGLDSVHGAIADPTDQVGTNMEEAGNRMQSAAERNRLKRMNARRRNYASPDGFTT